MFKLFFLFVAFLVKQSVNKMTQEAWGEKTTAQMMTLSVDQGVKLILVPSL